MGSRVEDTLRDLAHAWDRGMVRNDAEAVGSFMADEWEIVGSNGRAVDKASFLALVRSGDLVHDKMTSEDFHIRVFGDTAVVLTRGVSAGKYRGHAFREHERSTCVFVRRAGEWKCVWTHVSPIAAESPRAEPA
jgi:ketosteroid isomerase-like protein